MIRRLFWVAALLLVAALLAVAFSLRTYRALTRLELVAVVHAAPAPPGTAYRFTIELTQVRGGEFQPRETYPMHGDQWTVGGDFLKWAPWLAVAGAPPMYKLTRVQSQYLSAADEVGSPRSAYELNGGGAPLWRWLRWFGPAFPLVDAVYGSAVYTEARPGGRWGVYVSYSGFLILPS